jgi:hypothetical protein
MIRRLGAPSVQVTECGPRKDVEAQEVVGHCHGLEAGENVLEWREVCGLELVISTRERMLAKKVQLSEESLAESVCHGGGHREFPVSAILTWNAKWRMHQGMVDDH